MFHRGTLLKSVSNNEFQPQSFISGQSTGYVDLIQAGKVNMICVAFRPSGAKAFFPFMMNEINGESISVDALSCPDLRELEDRLQNTYDNEVCFRLIESFLLKRLYLSKEYNHKRMAAVIGAVNGGQADINILADISCLGYKQFNRVFTGYVGATPKEFLRVVRFQKALFLLQNQPDLNLTRLAYECGCYDQSHLIKEFKSFSGYTPSEYISTCAPYSDYFS